MKLLKVKILNAETCGHLLDGFEIRLRPDDTKYDTFDPLCLIGPNGSGKSQFMQAIAEIFQAICHGVDSASERIDPNPTLEFEIEYLIRPEGAALPIHVRATRSRDKRKRMVLQLLRKVEDEWVPSGLETAVSKALLPDRVVGYTSGENETLSLPFLVSRSGYAKEVRDSAIPSMKNDKEIPDTLLMLIDYGTNLEVLVANQMLSGEAQRKAILAESNVHEVHSCRCIIQIGQSKITPVGGKRGVRLTDELSQYIGYLKKCSTCYSYDERLDRHVFDYYIDHEMRQAFGAYWKNALQLYSAFHKLAMLNDLVIPKRSRDRFNREIKDRSFASRLPEPQEEDKVFRFEQVKFRSATDGSPVDYVSLSDGEHQRTQILGTMAMQSSPGVLFLMDEPESHFNPKWRVEFVSRILDLPTDNGRRMDQDSGTRVDEQECLLTTHGPFVPSDMQSEKVFIFRKEDGKVTYSHPDVETYGTTFDSIVQTCFGVRPPISNKSLDEIEDLLESEDADRIQEALGRLGHSVQKAFLIEHLANLQGDDEE